MEPSLPAKAATLGPRQREIASIVYATTAATPRDIQARLSDPRSVRVVRTLLDRMIAKGLVRCRPSGRHNEMIYIAAIATPQVKEAAVKKLVSERFGGSLGDAAATLSALAKRESQLAHQVPRTSATVKRRTNELGGLWMTRLQDLRWASR
jgi:predicted transcriptional regulator